MINPLQTVSAWFPLGLGYIAAVLKKKHKIRVFDINLLRLSKTGVVSNLKELLPQADIVLTGDLSNAYRYIKWLNNSVKSIKPGINIVVGNAIATYSPELVLKNLNADVVVIGEGEKTIEELLDFIEKGKDLRKVNGIGYKRGKKIVLTAPRERIQNLDSVPFPAWELFDIGKYIKYPLGLSGHRKSMNMTASRGCPFRCKFCSRVFGNKVVFRRPESVVQEIKELNKRYGVTYFGFGDDLFVSNPKNVHELSRLLEKEKLKIRWHCNTRASYLTDSLVKAMKKGGCVHVLFGAESGCQRILDNMQKGQKVSDIIRAVELLRKNRLSFRAFFMAGYPGEDRSSIEETTEIRMRYNLLGPCKITTPYPGSDLYNESVRQGRIKDEDKYLEKLSGHRHHVSMVINLTDLSDKELINLKKESDRKIHSSIKRRFIQAYNFFKITGIIGGIVQVLKVGYLGFLNKHLREKLK